MLHHCNIVDLDIYSRLYIYIYRSVRIHRVGNTRDDNRQCIACLNGKAHYATEVFGAVTIQARRVPDLLEPQIGRRSVVLIVVV